MTGLCGWIGPTSNGAPAERTLADMARALPRREGAEGGARADSRAGLHVEDWSGHCGMAPGDGPWVGIAGFPRWSSTDLARVAAERGHAAALREAYRDHGKDLLRHLCGPFVLAVLEPAAGRALVAIDRFAVHTLCYASTGAGSVVFGSTTDSVRAHPGVTSTIPAQSIYDFLFLGVCPSPRTIYREQQKLLPGQYLWVEDARAAAVTYWQMPYRGDGPARSEDLAEELKSLLAQSVRRTLDGQDPAAVGAFLSGGLDSTTIAGYLAGASPQPPKTFTVTFERTQFDESRYANEAAAYYSTKQHEYRLTPRDVLEHLPKVAELYDEPFGNSSAMPTYYCARMAREKGMGVVLAGDGGDEIFAGNERYVAQMVFGLYERIPSSIRSLVIEPIASRLPFTERVTLLRKIRSYVARARTRMPDRMETYNFWASADLSEALEPDALARIDPDGPLEIRRRVYERPDANSVLHRMLHLDLTAALADNDLRKVNRMCWMAGVQVRYPFLDEDLAEFAARVPLRRLIRGFKIRHFYRQALADFLPPTTLAKDKHGFGMPFEDWLKEDPGLRALAQDAVSSFKRRGYLKASFLDQVIGAAGTLEWTPHDGIIWDIMTLELWLNAHNGAAQEYG